MEYGAFVAVEDVYNKALAYSTPFGHAWYVFFGGTFLARLIFLLVTNAFLSVTNG